MLKRYIETLKTETDAANLKRKVDKDVKRRPLGVKPLTIQIEELMRSLPPSMRDRAWTMDDLVHRLQGKYRDRPHPADVGKALRALGWSRVRDWSASSAGRRVWLRQRSNL